MGDLIRLQAATLAARQRTGDKSIGTRVEAGRAQVVRVAFNAAGNSAVQPVTGFLPAADAVAWLEKLQ